ncbi:helix-turn-helix domain-containing protein [Methanomassiliicoccus luminyensis]|uniref:hypothetical protein n=1 Tax=Methanomassiliicoccus luminyensis TaxID=1080712 RepID=UPI000375C6EF|nr:hypothetical protein [Methanomassiliicoccus luminyensis]
MYFDIAQLTCDIDRRRILSATDVRPRSVKDIAKACHLSLSRCYRLIKEMEESAIIRRAGVDKREAMYISNLRSVEMSLEDDRLSLSVVFRDGTEDRKDFTPQDLERGTIRNIPQELLSGEPSREPSTAA